VAVTKQVSRDIFSDIFVTTESLSPPKKAGSHAASKLLVLAGMNRVFHVVIAVCLVGIAYGVLDRMLTFEQGACLAGILVLVAAGKLYLSHKAAQSPQR